MAKFFQLVAVVLIGAILGGTQCAELCSFLSVKRQAQAKQASGNEMPCHRKHSSQDSQPPPPAGDESCAHRELVAEKRSEASPTDDLQTVSLAAIRIEAQLVPGLSSAPLTRAYEHFPKLSPLALTSILRV